jgi:chemotaxis signal transduction protein
VTDSQLASVAAAAGSASDSAASDHAVDEAAAIAAETEAIVVHLGTGRFAVDLVSIAEVGRVPVITRVPGMPGWLSGVANWRGRILPVLDLRPLLGADVAQATNPSRLLVLTGNGIAVGLIVDAVEGTTSLADVAAFPPASAPSGPSLLCGQVPRTDGPIAVLDVAAVLRMRESLPRGRRSA